MSTVGRTDARQYSLAKILWVWSSVTVPMGLLSWVLAPWLIPRLPLASGVTYWLLMVCGMAWQSVVALVLLRGERRHFSRRSLRQRLWLQAPRHPGSGRRDWRLLWWALPAIAFVALSSDLLGDHIDAPLRWLFPGLVLPAHANIQTLVSPAFEGAWWLLGLALVSCVFNYLLGEALLFHAVLLPRMRGVFGRHAWLANAVLFGLYHVHLLPALPSIVVSNLAYSLPAQRFRSAWLAVVIHGAEGLVLLTMVALVILGRVPAPA